METPVSRLRRERRRVEQIARRREDVLAAASSVFAAKGYHDAQMTDIARAAELSRASVYAMFEGKDALFEEVISTTAVAVQNAVRSKVEALRDPGEQLLCVIDSLLDCFERNRDLVRLYSLDTNAFPFKMREVAGETTVEIFKGFTSWVVEIARRAKAAGYLKGLDPETVGVSLVGTVNTTAMRWVESVPERPLLAAGPPLRAIFRQLLQQRTVKG